MTTITVAMTGTWLTDPITLTSLQLWKVARAESDDLDVAVRVYAGGRRRVITTPSTVRSTPLTFRGVTAQDLATLRGWRGRVLLLRDPAGWRRWGVYGGVEHSTGHPAPMTPLFDVSVTFTDVDYVEGA